MARAYSQALTVCGTEGLPAAPAVPPQAAAYTLRWGGDTLGVATGTFPGQRRWDVGSNDYSCVTQPTQPLCSWDLPVRPARRSHLLGANITENSKECHFLEDK